MRPGNVQYRCRRCGEVDSPIHTPCVDLTIVDLVVHGRDRTFDGVPVHMTHSHACADGGVGIADCIGVQPDPPRVES